MAPWQLRIILSVVAIVAVYSDSQSLRGAAVDQQSAPAVVQPQASQLPVTPKIDVPSVVPGVAPPVNESSVDPNAMSSADPMLWLILGADTQANEDVLKASQLQVSPEINISVIVPGVTPPVNVYVPSVDPNEIVVPAASGLQGAGVGAHLAGQANEVMPKSTQAEKPAMLASSSIPAWCQNIPSEGQQYIAACGGSGNAGSSGNSQESSPTSGGVPSWCNDMPASSRANVPSCVNNSENGSLSSAPRAQSWTAVLVAFAVVMAGTFL